ncbi:MAG TPA: acyltransferase [Alphaproteobacteria bacterium]|jgi:surface polysaccharide O-acyltransferase-like enzyme|nr:acyltransferase [Alphaproteobacteria bacterium]
MIDQKPHVKSIDALRTFSILAVILIHTTTRTLETSGYNLNAFGFTLFLNQLARFAVPLFFLISGFVLELNFDSSLNYFSYLKKRLNKILIPYIFWSLIYYLFVYTQNHENFLKILLTGSASYQLYFIPTLLIFYILFPLLHKFYKVLANIFVLTILGVSQIWLMHQDYVVHQFNFVDPIRISLLAYFVFILGIVVARNKDKILEIISKIKFLLIPVVGYLVFYIFNEGKTRYFITYNIESFYSQWRVSVLFYTLALASLLFYIFDKEKLQFKIINQLSKLSFLVFFIHVIILEITWPIFGKNDIVFFATVSGVSFGVAYLASKIPNLNKLTG